MIAFIMYTVGLFAFLVAIVGWDKKLTREEYKNLLLASFGLVIVYGLIKGVVVL